VGRQWQVLDPGIRLVPDSADALRWSRELGLPFYEAAIETNGHNLSLVSGSEPASRSARRWQYKSGATSGHGT
jgi:hypothetical protein